MRYYCTMRFKTDRMEFFKSIFLFLTACLLMSCKYNTTVEQVLEKHFEAIGNTKVLENDSYSMTGVIDFSALKINFDYSQTNNRYYYFKQHEVVAGMDYTPPLMKILNDEGAYFLVDMSGMEGGMEVSKLPNEAVENWKKVKTTELSPLYYFKKLGLSIKSKGVGEFNDEEVLENKDDDMTAIYGMAAEIPDKNIITELVNYYLDMISLNSSFS